jgi:hypothetical protein
MVVFTIFDQTCVKKLKNKIAFGKFLAKDK